jgi:hypothetical protein
MTIAICSSYPIPSDVLVAVGYLMFIPGLLGPFVYYVTHDDLRDLFNTAVKKIVCRRSMHNNGMRRGMCMVCDIEYYFNKSGQVPKVKLDLCMKLLEGRVLYPRLGREIPLGVSNPDPVYDLRNDYVFRVFKCTKTCDNILHFFYKIIYFLNQQNKKFASKQNFNNLMIKIYFFIHHKNQSESFEPTLWVVMSFLFFMHAQMKHG